MIVDRIDPQFMNVIDSNILRSGHGRKTATHFLIPLSANLKPSRPSSCVVAAQWLALHNASLNTP
jgi:hypothetical protein